MFGSLMDDLKFKVDSMLRLAVLGMIAAAAATVAFFCFAIALFLWMQQTYGPLEAWLALGALFVGLAAIGGIAAMVLRRRVRRTAPPERDRREPAPFARMLQDPAVIVAGVQIVRLLGLRTILPIALLGAVAGGVLLGRGQESVNPRKPGARANGLDRGARRPSHGRRETFGSPPSRP